MSNNNNSTNDTCAETTEDTNGLYYIQVEMVDGSSQILQIFKEQAFDLGVDLSDEILENETNKKTCQIYSEKNELVIDCDNLIQEQDIIVDGANITEYRILQPEDINLKLMKPSRGRIKRYTDQSNDIITVKPKRVKTVRTRSGRVTVPPKHIQEIYKRFLDPSGESSANSKVVQHTHGKSRSPSPLVIGDFTPLRTNDEEMPYLVPFEATSAKSNARRKSLLASQLKCATCNKAYIGKRNMRKHLKSFPDHKPKAKLNLADSKTWDCLIDTSKMAPAGRRGLKFCKELVNLLQNVKILVRYFFKLQKKLETNDFINELDFNEKGQYLMNDLLAKVLEIDKGWYTFNENELCKDVSIFSFLENFDSSVLSALSLNDSAMLGNNSKVSDGDQKISNKKDLVELLENDDKKSPRIENKIEISLDLGNESSNIDKTGLSNRDLRNEIVILSNVLIPHDIEVTNDCQEILRTNEIKENCYKLKNLDGALGWRRNKSADIFSNFLCNEPLLKAPSIKEVQNNECITLKTIDCSIEYSKHEVDFNLSLNEKDRNAHHKISADSTIKNVSVGNLLDVKTDVLVENNISNTNESLLDNSNDSINVDQFKYRIGELVVDNLDLLPLEIFQCDSNQ